ncbi:hypothetical protein ABEU81_00220 [Priestia megaterium]
MKKEVFMPKDITYRTALDFSLKLKAIDLSKNIDEVVVDIRHFSRSNGRIEPFAALLIINSLRLFYELAEQHKVNVKTIYLKERAIKNTYAKSLRFYSSLNLPIGESPDKDYMALASSTFIPIIKIDIASLKKSTDEYRDIKYLADHISNIASLGDNELKNYLDYCIVEILRNVDEHSQSKHVWCAAQYWPSVNGGKCVEIAIMDEGIGIQESLNKELDDEPNKLRYALIPGCSSRPTTHYIGDHADNAGFGLYMISEIGKANGDFILTSNSDSLYISQDSEKMEDSLVRGTIIRLRLKVDQLRDYELQKQELIDQGLSLAEKYREYIEIKKYAPGRILPTLF